MIMRNLPLFYSWSLLGTVYTRKNAQLATNAQQLRSKAHVGV